MRNPVVPALAIVLMAATAAQAQYGGAGGGSQRHGGGGSAHPGPATPHPVPVSDSDIVGVIKAIDPASNNVTIAYEPVEARNWPAGTMPFTVARPELLTGATVGEKVRFKVDSQRIVELNPY